MNVTAFRPNRETTMAKQQKPTPSYETNNADRTSNMARKHRGIIDRTNERTTSRSRSRRSSTAGCRKHSSTSTPPCSKVRCRIVL